MGLLFLVDHSPQNLDKSSSGSSCAAGGHSRVRTWASGYAWQVYTSHDSEADYAPEQKIKNAGRLACKGAMSKVAVACGFC